MKTSSKIYIFLLLIAIGAISYFGYPVIKSRYFQEKNQDAIEIKNTEEKEKTGTEISDGIGQDSMNDENGSDKDIIPEEKTTIYEEISREDCLNECKNYDAGQTKDYCLQSCGLSPVLPAGTEGCDKKSGLEKDYCNKDLGIRQQNFKICEKISDKNVRKACATRITEDILEKANPL